MRRLGYELRLLCVVFMASLIGCASALALIWASRSAAWAGWATAAAALVLWTAFAAGAKRWLIRPLQTLSNVLAGLRQGDFSVRVRGARAGDALGEALLEVNELGHMLQQQRIGALEATALLGKVMTEIDVAIFAFDRARRLRLLNRAGERLLAQPAERLLGMSAEQLSLAEFLEGETARTVNMEFPGGAGRWSIRRSRFRERGVPHDLLVISDLSRELRQEERRAFERLIRVLGHELNNSLAPIKSIAGSLESLLSSETALTDSREDLRRGLSVIAARAEALGRFMSGYARLAELPEPRLEPVELGALMRRVIELESRMEVSLVAPCQTTIRADPDQLEQVLINLVRNAVEAALESGGRVQISCRELGDCVEICIDDEGPGIANAANLFVPFFTTKPNGSGIGLVLSRQIAEAHGGSLTLENRQDGRGCRARLLLPLG